jgi:hypothetical protein
VTVTPDGAMSNELEVIWKEAVMAKSTFYPNICLERMKRKNEENS